MKLFPKVSADKRGTSAGEKVREKKAAMSKAKTDGRLKALLRQTRTIFSRLSKILSVDFHELVEVLIPTSRGT